MTQSGGRLSFMKRVFGILCLLVVCAPVLAHSSIPEDLLSIYSNVYSTRHGLPSNHVGFICQDTDGRIWMCTQQGVAAYNGQEITTYPFADNEVRSVTYNSILHDSKGRTWFGVSVGVAFLSNKGIVGLPVNWHKGDPPDVTDIVEDGQSRIWGLCDSRHICRLDNRTLQEPEWEDKTDETYVTRLRQADDGSIWIGTDSGFCIMRNAVVTAASIPIQNPILDFCLDSSESGWCLDLDGNLYRFQENSIEKVATVPEVAARSTYDITSGKSGEVWIATLRGLFLWHKAEMTNFMFRNGLASNYITAVFVDREGCIWYGSDNGLGKIPGLIFRRLLPTRDMPLSSVFGICQDVSGSTWFATNEGLIRINHSGSRVWKLKDGLMDESLYTVVSFGDGVVVSNTYGVFEIDQKGTVRVIIEDEKHTFTGITRHGDQLWLSSPQGLCRYTRKLGLEDLENQLPFADTVSVNSTFFDTNDNLWIATDGEGLFKATGSNLKTLEPIADLPSPRVFSISQSSNGTIWAGTFKGLCNLKELSTHQIFNCDHGLIAEDIWTVLCDQNEGIWVSSSRGVSSIVNGRIDNYDYHDGLSGEDFIANCRHIDNQGRLWFGGMGVTLVDPAEQISSTRPLTRFRFAQVNGMPLQRYQQIPAGRNTFEFGLMCSSFRNEFQNRFRYQLHGYDDFRSKPTQSSEIRYTNLPAGDYSLSVESANRDGQWSSEPIAFEFHVLPAWYQRKIVWLLGLLVFLLMMRLVIRFRSYQLAKTTNRLQEEVHRQTRVIQKQMERLEAQKNLMERQAKIDDLTKLFNRRHFYRKLRDAWIMRRIDETAISLIIFDLDHFKLVNDTYGHQTGDAVLRQVATAIRSRVPLSGLAARYGGEEFVLMLNNCDLDRAYQVAEDIRCSIEELAIGGIEDSDFQVTISAGVACRIGVDTAESPDALIQEADEALYKAKAAGRNRIVKAG